MISLDDYSILDLEDRTQFLTHNKKYPPPHSDYVFTTMICWKDYVDYFFTFYENNLFIMTKFKDNIQFRPPLGTFSNDLNKKTMKLALKEGGYMPFGMIPTSTKNNMLQYYPDTIFVNHRDFYDYVYLATDLAELGGKPYSKIRNRLNKFVKNNQYIVNIITDENFIDVKEFLKRWCLWKDCESDELLEHERRAILFSMAHFHELDLKGLFVSINDQIEAIVVFEQITPDTIIVHFEKGSPDYDGIYKLINWETAKMVKANCTYINRESDMGVSGLRKAKLSYRPYHFNEVYHLDRDNLEKILK